MSQSVAGHRWILKGGFMHPNMKKGHGTEIAGANYVK